MLNHIQMPEPSNHNHQPVLLNLSFQFTTNNRIFFPNGKYKDLFNHTYHFTVCIQSPVNAYGLGIDFYKIEEAYHNDLAKKLNHPILNETLPFNTTVENIASYIYQTFTSYIGKNASVHSVTLYETNTHSVTINEQNMYLFEV